MPPIKLVATSVELALLVAGAILLWRLELSSTARAKRVEPLMPKWEISTVDFVIFLWCVLFGGFIGQFATLQILKFIEGLPSDTRQIVAGAGFQLGLLFGCLIFRLFPGAKAADIARPRSPLNPLLAGGAVFLMAMPLITLVGAIWQFLLQAAGIEAARQELFDLFANVSSPALLAVLIILAVVIAPITEELIFRAGIFRFARGRLPRVLAFLVPALLFAALHANLASLLQLVTLGILFSIAYERTGDIRVSMVAHGLFNLNSVLLLVAGVDS